MSEVFRTLVVPAASQTDAQNIHAANYTNGGLGMYTTPCSATGTNPPTWYISSGMVDSTFASLLRWSRAIPNVSGGWTILLSGTGNAGALLAAATAAGYATDLATVNALLTASDISDQPPFAVLTRMGLQMIPGTP